MLEVSDKGHKRLLSAAKQRRRIGVELFSVPIFTLLGYTRGIHPSFTVTRVATCTTENIVHLLEELTRHGDRYLVPSCEKSGWKISAHNLFQILERCVGFVWASSVLEAEARQRRRVRAELMDPLTFWISMRTNSRGVFPPVRILLGSVEFLIFLDMLEKYGAQYHRQPEGEYPQVLGWRVPADVVLWALRILEKDHNTLEEIVREAPTRRDFLALAVLVG